jgi:tRNA (Thr-GGU) A37 N-methylase
MRQNPPAPPADVPLTVIGLVRSAYREPETTPIQAALDRAGHGTIEIAAPYREGLAGLDGFGYAWLLTWLHQPGSRDGERPPGGRDGGRPPGGRDGGRPPGGRDGGPPLRQVPYLLRGQQREMGIFATRGPRRVNPLGLSLIQLLGVTAQTVAFAGVDVIDGTPVVDLKPYVTRFDRPPGDPPCGWFDDLDISDGSTPAGLGPPPG